MIAQPQYQLMTPQEYLEWEEEQPLKYQDFQYLRMGRIKRLEN
jgi:hypothetical protein